MSETDDIKEGFAWCIRGKAYYMVSESKGLLLRNGKTYDGGSVSYQSLQESSDSKPYIMPKELFVR